MNYKHCCIVDANGVYKTFVVVLLEEDEDGAINETILGYEMTEEDQLIDALVPTRKIHAGDIGFVKPRWDKTAKAWVEGATAEELTAWEAEHPAPEVPEPEPSGNYVTYGELAKAIREGVNAV